MEKLGMLLVVVLAIIALALAIEWLMVWAVEDKDDWDDYGY